VPSTYYSSTYARPPVNYGVNSNFYQPPNSTMGCFKCGDPSHRIRECPGYSAEQRQTALQQQQPSQQPAPAQPQPDVRPVKDRSGKQDKTCIWVKYRQHKIYALIDTGSDVSIAGEDVARKMGWTIHKHRIKEVCVANNEVMSVRGAAYVTLTVAGRGIESEILIAPDLDGLILGIDWLRHQGRVRWDFEHGRIRFGDREWVKLRREAEQPWNSIIGEYSPAACHISSYRTASHAGPTDSARRFRRSDFGRTFLHEVLLFCHVMRKAESEGERGYRDKPLSRQRISDIKQRTCDDVFATLSRHPPRLQDLWTGYMIVRSARRTCLMLRSLLRSERTSSAEGGTETKKDSVEDEPVQELSRNNEGKAPRMGSQSFLLGEMTAWSGRWARIFHPPRQMATRQCRSHISPT